MTQRALGHWWDGRVGVAVRRTRVCGDGEAAAGEEEERRCRSRLLHDVSAVVEVVLEASCLQASLFVVVRVVCEVGNDKAESTVATPI